MDVVISREQAQKCIEAANLGIEVIEVMEAMLRRLVDELEPDGEYGSCPYCRMEKGDSWSMEGLAHIDDCPWLVAKRYLDGQGGV